MAFAFAFTTYSRTDQSACSMGRQRRAWASLKLCVLGVAEALVRDTPDSF